MTNAAALQEALSEDSLVSSASREVRRRIWELMTVGWEQGMSTAVADSVLLNDYMEERFSKLAETWRQETAHLSSVADMALHPAYQQIVGMGPSALPFILAELQARPDHWFWALRAITGEDPVHPDHRGNIGSMARDWLDWAARKGIRW